MKTEQYAQIKKVFKIAQKSRNEIQNLLEKSIDVMPNDETWIAKDDLKALKSTLKCKGCEVILDNPDAAHIAKS